MFQSTCNRVGKLSEINRLQQVIEGAAFHHLDGQGSVDFACEKDYLDGLIFLLNDLEDRRSGQVWHSEIQNAYIRPKRAHGVESFTGIGNSIDLITMNDQQLPDE